MSPALNESSAIWHFKHSEAIKTCDGIIFNFTRDWYICNRDINSSKLVQHRNLLYSLFRNLFICFRVTLCSTSTWAILFSGLKVSRNFTQFLNFTCNLRHVVTWLIHTHMVTWSHMVTRSPHTHMITWSPHTWSHDPHTHIWSHDPPTHTHVHMIPTHLITRSTHTWSHDPHTLDHMIHTHTVTWSTHTHTHTHMVTPTGFVPIFLTVSLWYLVRISMRLANIPFSARNMHTIIIITLNYCRWHWFHPPSVIVHSISLQEGCQKKTNSVHLMVSLKKWRSFFVAMEPLFDQVRRSWLHFVGKLSAKHTTCRVKLDPTTWWYQQERIRMGEKRTTPIEAHSLVKIIDKNRTRSHML